MRKPRRAVEIALVLVIIAIAVYRRLEFVTDRPFWVDEAESSINALTILQHGVPVDRYLGLPIYENTLIKPWPGNPEYEFKDISYSDRGLATYHGWLPLYSMAACFALFDVAPDDANGPAPHRTAEEFRRRTGIARLAPVFFSAVFLVLCYWGGIALYGRDAGLTALLVGCIHQTQMDIATTARYYSATVALSTAALLCLWFVLTKGQWKHYMIAAGIFTLLFYTHLVTFAAGCLAFSAVAGLLLWRKRNCIPMLLGFGGLLTLMTVPWMLVTGFLSGLGSAPPACALLSFPADFITFPLARGVYIAAFGTFLAAALAARVRWISLRDRVRTPLHHCPAAIGLLSVWIVCGYAAFLMLMPAASFFPSRLNLSYWGPTLLLGSLFCATLARIFTGRFAIVSAPLLALFLLWVTGHDIRAVTSPESGQTWDTLAALTNHLESQKIPQTARLYAAPNDHLVLTFYTGRPFQSIAPVRKSFLNSYRGDIVYVSRGGFLTSAAAEKQILLSSEISASRPDDAEYLKNLWRTRQYRREMSEAVLGVPMGSDGLATVKWSNAPVAEPAEDSKGNIDAALPMFRGYKTAKWYDWRAIFFYRFVNPASRSGKLTNYAERLCGSNADLLTNSDWAIYYSSFHEAPGKASVRFRVLP